MMRRIVVVEVLLPGVVGRLLHTEFGATVKVKGVPFAVAPPGVEGVKTAHAAGGFVVVSTVKGVPLEAVEVMETVCAPPGK